MDVIEMNKLEDILSAIKYNGGGITSLLGKGCVKSVQRGLLNTSKTVAIGFDGTVDVKVMLGSVNAEKCFVVTDFEYKKNDSMLLTVDESGILTSVETDGFTLKIPTKNSSTNTEKILTVKGQWQVVEFQ